MPKKNAEYNLFDYDVDLVQRIIYIGSQKTTLSGAESGVEAALSEKVIKGLYLMEAQAPNGDKPITIILNNPGGDIYHGLAIIDSIRACKNPVKIIVRGMAMSMAAWILQAGSERILSPNSRVMIHYGWCSINNHSKAAMEWAKEEERVNTQMEDEFLDKIQQKHPKFTRQKLHDMLKFDKVLTAEEAVELGLADRLE